MPTDLTPAEKDDRQIERLIDKEPAPSRKPAGRGAPKHDNRRRRMQDTSEETKRDEDLSNRTHASVFFIAEKVAKKRDREEELDSPAMSARDEGKKLVEDLFQLMKSQSYDLASEFRDYARSKYAPILFSKTPDAKKQQEVVKSLRKRMDMYETLSETDIKGSPANMAAQIAKLWPNGKKDAWATRAGVIAAVQNSIKNTGVPASVKAAMLRDPASVEKDQELIRDIMKDAYNGNLDESLMENRVQLAGLTATYRALQDNPLTIDAASLTRNIDKITTKVEQDIGQLAALPAFMKTWEKAIGAFDDEGIDSEEDTKSSEFYKSVLHSLDTFFKPKEPIFAPDAFIDGLESFYGEDSAMLPDELRKVLKGYRGKAASYSAIRGKAMGQRTATYHGVLQQGDPTHGPYTGYQSYDKRYFGKKNYDSIVKTAKQFLKEDWLSNDWEGGAKDANFRAALDLSIHLADSSLYQGKIDVETYNMLLARLMGDKTDVFAETLITNDDSTKSRRASAMSNQHIQNLLRVASGLRKENPRAALEIVKSIRALTAQDQQEGEQQGEEGESAPPPAPQQAQQQQGQQDQQGQCAPGMPAPAAPAAPAPAPAVGQQQQQQGQQQQGQQDQQGHISDQDMDAFVEGKVDIKDLKNETKKLVDAKSIEDFVDGLMDLDELVKKTASGSRTAEDETAGIEDVKLESLEDMDEEAVKAFLEKQKAEAQKLLGENDIEKFLEGLDKIFGEAESAAKGIKTGSVIVSMSSLVRLAHDNPDARPVLLAMIREAAKKKQKKDKRKKDKAKKKGKKPNPFAKKDEKGGKSKGGKKPPFGGKKAPPFGGKKAPPFGKKKSSVNVDLSDAEW